MLSVFFSDSFYLRRETFLHLSEDLYYVNGILAHRDPCFLKNSQPWTQRDTHFLKSVFTQIRQLHHPDFLFLKSGGVFLKL